MFVAVHPERHAAVIDEALASAECTVVPVADAAAVAELEPGAGWAALVVELRDDPEPGLALARRVREDGGPPVLVVAVRTQLGSLDVDCFDDFVLTPLDPAEVALRVRRLAGAEQLAGLPERVRFKDLELDLATYQARVGERSLDLTYMEYELLSFFVGHTGRVWSREQLLSRVWGYDYFGGARTVDVHVRRLRAKLGEERSGWITTVRSVGYRFG
jgi:DNA-binding response OmpR family regulator